MTDKAESPDIATLGLCVDTSDVEAATAKVHKLADAVKRLNAEIAKVGDTAHGGLSLTIAGEVVEMQVHPRGAEVTHTPLKPPTLADTMSAELADVTLTADDVAGMRKAEVVEMIEAMGAKPVDGGVADLRAQLVGLL